MPSVTINHIHNMPCPPEMSQEEYQAKVEDGELVCELELEIELEIEPGGMEGQDADGNRGYWVPASASPVTQAPDKCPDCGHQFDLVEVQELEHAMEKAAEAYEPDTPEYEPDYDDYDYDR